jgi:hypothetical protein
MQGEQQPIGQEDIYTFQTIRLSVEDVLSVPDP